MKVKEEKDTGFAERLRKLRIQKGISQVQLAKQTNINNNYISKYERGDAIPEVKNLKSLAEALEVSVDYLYDGIEEDAAIADFQDKDFLEIFKKAEALADNDKEVIKKLITAFLMQKEFQQKYAS